MKKAFIPMQIKRFIRMMSGVVLASVIFTSSLYAADTLKLYTPYTRIAVPPGESLEYNIDIINNTGEIQDVEISLTGIPRGWNYNFKAGKYDIRQLSVLPGEKRSFFLYVEVPIEVNKGSYRFNVVAKGFGSLPINVIVSEQGTFRTELIATQLNMEGPSNSVFTYEAELRNRTIDNQLYALSANVPRGWNITFKVDFKPVTSVNIESNNTKRVTIEVDPPDDIESGEYKIPIAARTSNTSATLDLEAVVLGRYGLELTTPRGLVSTDITAGDEKEVELVVRNTGSVVLRDITFHSNVPIQWSATFEPDNISMLEAGKQENIIATIKASKDAIAGDYMAILEARTVENTSEAEFRISVVTPLLWGWIGVLTILIAVGSVLFLFKKYGRR